jgi:ABC-type dipeptide/oligopeptide/nickel transport system permease component
MLEVLGEDFIRAARAKGAGPTRVAVVHALRNALIPVVTLMALQFGTLLAGAVITEAVFAWPGIGSLALNSIIQRDYPVVQAIVVLGSVAIVVANLVADMLYVVLDPRLRTQAA